MFYILIFFLAITKKKKVILSGKITTNDKNVTDYRLLVFLCEPIEDTGFRLIL